MSREAQFQMGRVIILEFIDLGEHGIGINDMLRELFYGRISPYGAKLPKDTETQALIKRSSGLETELNEILDEAGREKFSDFLRDDGELCDIQRFQSFCFGYRIGARLMLETLMNEPSKQ